MSQKKMSITEKIIDVVADVTLNIFSLLEKFFKNKWIFMLAMAGTYIVTAILGNIDALQPWLNEKPDGPFYFLGIFPIYSDIVMDAFSYAASGFMDVYEAIIYRGWSFDNLLNSIAFIMTIIILTMVQSLFLQTALEELMDQLELKKWTKSYVSYFLDNVYCFVSTWLAYLLFIVINNNVVAIVMILIYLTVGKPLLDMGIATMLIKMVIVTVIFFGGIVFLLGPATASGILNPFIGLILMVGLVLATPIITDKIIEKMAGED